LGSFEAVKAWRVEVVGQVHAEWADGRAVANAKAGRVNHVIEVSEAVLLHAEGKVVRAGEGVAEIVKQNAADILSDKREPQFGLIEEQRIAADGEAGLRVARSGLLLGEG